MIRGFERVDPPPNRQKALTPALLKDTYEFAQLEGGWTRHAADLIIGGYFFAMRACEFCATERPGRTRKLTLGQVVFRDEESKPIAQEDPLLSSKAMFVTVCFVDQKNGSKMEKRSHRRSGHSLLCPVRAWARVTQRVRREVKSDDYDAIPVCAHSPSRDVGEQISSGQILTLLRKACSKNDGANKYGISPNELGTRSIRSGAAMALALTNKNQERKIMMLGRWKSLAFLDYIRPQVLEWAGKTASQMAKTINFLDVGENRRQTGRPPHQTDNEEVEIPGFTHLNV